MKNVNNPLFWGLVKAWKAKSNPLDEQIHNNYHWNLENNYHWILT